jgi:class 3 adenylate cyclase
MTLAGTPAASQVTMMFTDIVGSSPIKRLIGATESEQDRAWVERFQQHHHAVIRACCAAHRGEEIKTIGDAFFVVFADAADAVGCAVSIQQSLAAANLTTPLPGNPALQVRIGLHTSAPVRQGQDYVGTSVDLTARIEGAAVGGQVLVSKRTRDLAADRTPGITFYEQGDFALKGVGVHALFEVLWPGRIPCRTGQQEITQYLERERERILAERAAGFRDLYVRDTVASDLFVAGPWKDGAGQEQTRDICEHLVGCFGNVAPHRVLLLGQPGQGKTTILKRLFVLLAELFLAGQSRLLPIYLRLRDCADAQSATFGTREWLWTHLRDGLPTTLPLDYEQFCEFLTANRIVFLLDGFDEICFANRTSVNQVALRPLFQLPAVLSCRKGYFELYLRASPIQERFGEQIELRPWRFDESGQRYVDAFVKRRQPASADNPLNLFVNNEASQELADRPLLLAMMLDVWIAGGGQRPVREASSLAALYEAYTQQWLSVEAGRADSILPADEKAHLLQELAWSLHTADGAEAEAYGQWRCSAVCTRQELSDVVESFHRSSGASIGDVAEDLRLRSFLVEDRRDCIAFMHLSFQEYFVARYIYDRLQRGVDAVAEVFRASIPLPVGLFLLDMLDAARLPASRRERISSHLIAAAGRFQDADEASISIREHAAFYLAKLQTAKGRAFLERMYPLEANEVVKRSMMVGLGLFWKRDDVIEQYLHLLRQNPTAAEVNLGYHLVYFGDQPREEGFVDRGQTCERTLRAIVRHLQDVDAYGSIWPLDLLTLNMFLERRGSDALSSDEVQIVRGFIERRAADVRPAFRREILDFEQRWERKSA